MEAGQNKVTKEDQSRTPLFDAVKRHIEKNIIPFHVPGHKYGRGLKEFTDFVGQNVMLMDLNGMEDLDNANNPIGVIYEAEKLFASAFGAQYAYFLVNGTTSGVQTMIMSACEPGDEIILPRNAHKSAFGGIILSGAIPVYVQPEVNEELGITMGVTIENVKKAILKHPHAKAVFVINPTYYGIASDLKSITRTAHKFGMAVLVDEAHGAHMGFHNDFPLTAMEVGADMSAVSTHKTGGSLTQSSVLLLRGHRIQPETVKQVLNLTMTTSSSYILMCSIDVARKQLAMYGEEMLEETLRLARMAREEINKIEGLYAFGKELIGTPGVYDFDETKLGINVRRLGITGYEAERILRDEYNIQIEMSDLYNILAIISLGDTQESVEKLIEALRDMAKKLGVKDVKTPTIVLHSPQVIVSPRDAFYSSKKVVELDNAVGEISGEMVMAYPPGIPLILPGERITKDLVDYIKLLKEEDCQLQGTADPYVNTIRVLGTAD
ncbi:MULTISPECIES: aminotransferase class I/II-fold pyridoxal phosphate-dependent enzyme [Caldicellulosiruptor]|uniref:aminotransferase class I/II-fold pyridoxal phosphate-dependent enzyme n=1 Tax=Caldicellulosiruptor TaxID=44000 RepID=UPI00005E5FA3|nr:MULTISPECIES: aminotransferase class I/II-fold pyridoxal phosphate-dependent enzyme [Caldicellulosiruptor]